VHRRLLPPDRVDRPVVRAIVDDDDPGTAKIRLRQAVEARERVVAPVPVEEHDPDAGGRDRRSGADPVPPRAPSGDPRRDLRRDTARHGREWGDRHGQAASSARAGRNARARRRSARPGGVRYASRARADFPISRETPFGRVALAWREAAAPTGITVRWTLRAAWD